MISNSMFLLIVACAFVTWLPRILPFIIVKNFALPPFVLRFLSYIPVCLLSALVFDSLFEKGEFYTTFQVQNCLALIPTLTIALWTKNLALTVSIGVLSMGLIRFFL